MSDELIPRSEWPKLYREEDFQRQIVLRSKLIDEMVGPVYPKLLAAEISELIELMRFTQRVRGIIDQTLGDAPGTIKGLIHAISMELPHLETVNVDAKTRDGSRPPRPSDCVITVDKGELDTPEKEARIREAIYRVAPVALMFELKEAQE